METTNTSAFLSTRAREIGERNAAEDLAILARLRRSGIVSRDTTTPASHPFVQKVESMAFADRRQRGMDTIRSNKKKRKK